MFFLQDDFYQLTRADSIVALNWSRVFSLQPGYYRPLTQWILPAAEVGLFGYRAWPFHLTAVAVSCVNLFLLLLLFGRLVRNQAAAFLGALFYATRSAHYLKLYWISASAEAWMFFFFLLSILLFLRSVRGPKSARAVWRGGSVAAYSLAILSKETILLLPVLLWVWAGFAGERNGARKEGERWDWRRALRLTWPHWSVLACHLALRIGFGGMGGHGVYLLSKAHRILINGFAYAAMTLDFNRELIRQAHLREFPPVTVSLIGWTVGFVGAWVALPVVLFRRFSSVCSASTYRAFLRRRRKAMWIALAWMAAGAAPLVAMTLNFYGYYLTPFLGGLALLLALHADYCMERLAALQQQGRGRRALVVAGLLLVFLSFWSVRLQEESPHGAFQRAQEVRRFLHAIQNQVHELPEDAVVLFSGFSRKQYWALGWGYCMDMTYGAGSRVYFSEYEETNIPARLPPGPCLDIRLADGEIQAAWRTRTEGPNRGADKDALTSPLNPGSRREPHFKAEPDP